MQLDIHLTNEENSEVIVIDNFISLAYYGQSQKIFTKDLTGFELSDNTTYNFRGDTQVSLKGSKINYLELSDS